MAGLDVLERTTSYFSLTENNLHSNSTYDFETKTSYAICIRTTDNRGLYFQKPFTINITDVNESPQIETIEDPIINEQTLLEIIITAADPDLPGDILTFYLSGEPSGASITTGGVFTWTPTEAQGPGTYPLNICVSDGSLSYCEAIIITVNEMNIDPVLDSIGNQLIGELATLSFTATATDSDLPPNLLTFSLTGTPPAGASITTGGDFTWTPSEAQGPNNFDITVMVCDDAVTPACDQETITVSVIEVNNEPVLVSIGDRTVNELALLTFTATASDSDLPPNSLTFSLAGSSPAGASITTGGDFTWIPAEDQGPVDHNITIVVCDDAAIPGCDQETITVAVSEVNNDPVLATIGDKSVDELTLLTFTATATDSDLPPNTHTFSLAGTPPAGASITTGGVFTWTPTEAQGPGIYTFDVCVSDGTLSVCETIDVTVADINSSPVLDPIGNKSVDELVELSFTATASDSDLPANTLTFSLDVGAPGSAVIDPDTGVFTWTPTELQDSNNFDITVMVCDDAPTPACDQETITVSVSEVNISPELGTIGNQSVNELTELSLTATASDSDQPPNSLTFSLAGTPPAGASITTAGAFTWTPTELQGPDNYDITVMVCDDAAIPACDQETITVSVIEVNNAPELAFIGNQLIGELATLSFTAAASDEDLPANTLAFSLTGTPPAGASITTGGDFTWTPTEAQGPNDFAITVMVCDDAATPACDQETITVSVIEVNIEPVLVSIGDRSVDELALLTFTATASDSDLPPNSLTFSLAGTPPTGASITNDGVFTWTPAEDQGPDSHNITIVVCDDTSIPGCDQETITVSVSEVNNDPVLATIGDKSVDELTLLTFTATATDSDLPPNTLAFSLAGTLPAGASITNDGVFTWTPAEAQGPGISTFDVCVSDGTISVCETIDVTVADINVDPVLDPIGNKTVDELVELSFTATASDSDVPPNSLTFSLAGTPPTGASITSGGDFSWTPSEDQGPGTYTFDVCVSDGTLTVCETIDVTVADINSGPVLDPIGNKSVDEFVELAFTASASDSDLPANTLTFSLSGEPSGASITSGGVFTWTPTEAQGPGTYPFDVCVSDAALSDCETIEVTVADINSAPELDPIGNKSIDELSELTFTATASDSDLPANTLTFILSSSPSGASIDPNSGVFTWTPTEAQGPGIYTFDVCVNDGTLSICETIDVTVADINSAPELDPIGNKSIDELSELTFTAAASDSDLPANTLTFSLSSAPSGASIDPNSGVFTLTPTEAQGPADYTFDVCVSDGAASDCETITVTVSEVNIAPLLGVIGNQTVNELVELSFTATATDSDIPANILTFSLSGAPSGANITSGGVFSWIPTETQGPGTYTIIVCVNDGSLTDCESIDVLVNEINLPPTDINLSNNSIAENLPDGTVIGILSTIDPDNGDSFNYSLVNPGGSCLGTDNALFSISGSSLTSNIIFDYESKSSFTICIQSMDTAGLTTLKQFSINIIDANDPPTDIQLSNASILENQPLNHDYRRYFNNRYQCFGYPHLFIS